MGFLARDLLCPVVSFRHSLVTSTKHRVLGVEIAVGGWILWPQVGVTTGCDDSPSLAGARPEERGPAAGCGTHIARAGFATGLIHFAGGEIPGKNVGRDVIVPGRAATVLKRLALVDPKGRSSATRMEFSRPMPHIQDSANAAC